MFSKFSISTFKSPKIANDSRFRCLWTRIPVFVKSYTGMRVYHFKTPVYEFDDTGIRVHRHRYTSSRHRYTSSQTPGDEFVDTARRVTPQNVLAVYDFTDTGIRVHRHRYTSSQTPVYEFTTPVYEFTDTGIRVRRHRYTSSQTPEARVQKTGKSRPDLQKSMLKGQFNFFGS